MATGKERPRAAVKSPDLKQPKEILQKLLEIELERLDTAVRIEKERQIVFPETSVIIHDIAKLQAALNKKAASVDDWLSDLNEL